MNIKIISLAAAMAVSAAVAQDYDEEYGNSTEAVEEVEETEEVEEVEEAPAPKPKKEQKVAKEEAKEEAEPAAPMAEAKGLNVLHGSAYNPFGNEAGASTVRGNMNAPYKMAGTSLIYVEPSDEYAALSIAKGSMTYLLAFDNSANYGKLTAGIATKSFGVALDVALAKSWISDNDEDVSVVGAGDLFGAKFAAPLGSIDITANAYWLTYANEASTDNNENDKWDIGLNATLSNAPSAKDFFWSAGLDFVRHENSNKVKTPVGNVESTNNDANISIQPRLNIALPVLGNEDARVYVGLNSRIPVIFFDEIENKNSSDSYSAFGLFTSPNLLAEMSLTENWIIFGGAAFEWEVFSYASDELKNGETKDEGSVISMTTKSTNANAGARFQYKSLSVEASVASNLYTNAWSGLIGQFSAMLNF